MIWRGSLKSLIALTAIISAVIIDISATKVPNANDQCKVIYGADASFCHVNINKFLLKLYIIRC